MSNDKLNIEAFQKAIGDTQRDVRPDGGITANELAKETKITRSTARYHLNMLLATGKAIIKPGRVKGQKADFYVLTKCGYAAKYKATRKPRCGCGTREATFVAKTPGLPTRKSKGRAIGFGLPIAKGSGSKG